MLSGSRVDGEVQTPPFGVLGDVPSAADTSRVDFVPEDFESIVEVHGKRLAWTRAIRCPCAPLSAQIDQPDINCQLCKGLAWTYFGAGRTQALPDQTLTAAQRAVIASQDAFVIRGVITGLNKQDKPWDASVGAWRMGSASVSVRARNFLGFQDRIVNLDDRIIFTEVVESPTNPAHPLPLRYMVAGGVYMLRSVDRILKAGQDFMVRGGRVLLTSGQALPPETRLAAHYVTFPTFLVQSIPNASRETSTLDGMSGPQTGIGRSQQLPVRADLRLEFLPAPNGAL